jgi:outer membrane biosynthesis protein TonB
MALETEEEELKNGKIVAIAPNKKPVAAPKPAPKKSPAKKAKAEASKPKPAPAAQKAPAIANTAVLHRTSTACEMTGKRAETIKCLKDGMTVETFRAAVAKKFAKDESWNSGRTLVVLKVAIAAKLVTVGGTR